jgi:hypothetical protein
MTDWLARLKTHLATTDNGRATPRRGNGHTTFDSFDSGSRGALQPSKTASETNFTAQEAPPTATVKTDKSPPGIEF